MERQTYRSREQYVEVDGCAGIMLACAVSLVLGVIFGFVVAHAFDVLWG